MKITKRQLRRIIREACALEDAPQGEVHVDQVAQPQAAPDAVPVPQDYEAVRSFMGSNPDIVDLGISMVMELVGVSCERSTAQAIIDHLQDMLAGHGQEDTPGEIEAEISPAFLSGLAIEEL